jgi:hypothetical protein
MAGFEVITDGRFWVITKGGVAPGAQSLKCSTRAARLRNPD